MEDSPPGFITFRKPPPDRPRAYQLALDLVVHVHNIVERADVRFHLKHDLDRSTTGIAMTLTAVLEEPPSTRWRKYRAALKLATACTTLIDIMTRTGSTGTDFDAASAILLELREELAKHALYKV